MLIPLIAYMLPDRAESADGNTPISRLRGHVSLPLYIPTYMDVGEGNPSERYVMSAHTWLARSRHFLHHRQHCRKDPGCRDRPSERSKRKMQNQKRKGSRHAWRCNFGMNVQVGHELPYEMMTVASAFITWRAEKAKLLVRMEGTSLALLSLSDECEWSE